MAKTNDRNEIEELKRQLKIGIAKQFYIFHGQELYLKQSYLKKLRGILLEKGTEAFNHHAYDGKGCSIKQISDAIESLPAFSERTLVEVTDWQFYALPEEERRQFLEVVSDLPDYVCLLLNFESVQFAPDRRLKYNADICKKAQIVEFGRQDEAKLTGWLCASAKKKGKVLSAVNAEYLQFRAGGDMGTLSGELEKLVSVTNEEISRQDIDELVAPSPEAVAWQLTDAIGKQDWKKAMQIYSVLAERREPDHKLIAALSGELRRLQAAIIWKDSRANEAELKSITGIRYDFQLQKLTALARKITLEESTAYLRLCSETAFRLNSEPTETSDIMKQFIAELSMI